MNKPDWMNKDVFTPGKLSDKIKALNSSRVFKKITPKATYLGILNGLHL